MLVLLHIIPSKRICHQYTYVTDYHTSLIDCRHLTNDTISIRCAGLLAFTCGVKMMWLCQGLGWQPPWTASHIHIGHIQSDWAHWYAIHGHTVYQPYTVIPTLLGSDFGVLGHLWSQNEVIMSWLMLTATSNCFPHHIRHIQSDWAHWYAVH
jgi:hypothetical protein